MINRIKALIQNKLYQNCLEEYEHTLRYHKEPYLKWIKETEYVDEQEGLTEENYPSLSVVYMEQCLENFKLSEVKNDIVIFASRDGKISVQAFREINKCFEENEAVNIVYSDEDFWLLPQGDDEHPDDESLHRVCPCQKPVWAPDTLFSYNYFGNLFAVRRNAFLDIEWLGNSNYRMNIYDFLLKATQKCSGYSHIMHSDKILFHKYRKGLDKQSLTEEILVDGGLTPEAAPEYDFIRKAALERQGINADFIEKDGYSYPVYNVSGNPLVSIIIPSKDNLDVLKQCINSIYDRTSYRNYEIIVIDNGSSAQVKMSMQVFMAERGFGYYYMPMEFNFSKMCNIGVSKAKGEYILLLNDDMEVIEADWLEKMLGQAQLSHVGAVGAKLYYPDTKLIQHAGIYNTVAGPGHKLRKHDDTKCYYYGRNKLIYDMIGVTAACLLMRKDRFLEIDGLYEGLKIAYNDVDLCFKIYEKGWYCVQRNDVCLYHHESLSRGDDMADPKKFERMMAEIDRLFERHPKLYHRDPFLGFIMNSGEDGIAPRWSENSEFVKGRRPSVVYEGKKLPDKRKMNRSISYFIDDCRKMDKEATYNNCDPYYLLRGWMYIHGADNARYSFTLILEDESGKTWEIPAERGYRYDVAQAFANEKNIELTGFLCWFYENTIPKGRYRLWLKMSDGCSTKNYYVDTERDLEVEE